MKWLSNAPHAVSEQDHAVEGRVAAVGVEHQLRLARGVAQARPEAIGMGTPVGYM